MKGSKGSKKKTVKSTGGASSMRNKAVDSRNDPGTSPIENLNAENS